MRARSDAISARLVAPTTAPSVENPLAPTVAAPSADTMSATASDTVRPSASASVCSASPDGLLVRTKANEPCPSARNGAMPSLPRYALMVVQCAPAARALAA